MGLTVEIGNQLALSSRRGLLLISEQQRQCWLYHYSIAHRWTCEGRVGKSQEKSIHENCPAMARTDVILIAEIGCFDTALRAKPEARKKCLSYACLSVVVHPTPGIGKGSRTQCLDARPQF